MRFLLGPHRDLAIVVVNASRVEYAIGGSPWWNCRPAAASASSP